MNTQTKYIIKDTFSAKEALTRINELGEINIVLFVVNSDNTLVGTLTDGDIRRGFLSDLKITDSVKEFMNHNYKFIENEKELSGRLKFFLEKNIRFVPMIDASRKLKSIIDLEQLKSFIPVDALIMAGGRGERLRPLTDLLPKPMLKVGEKPILEHNVDRLSRYGVSNFHISLGYLGDKISSHFGNGESKDLNIKYITEEIPLGTIGAAGVIKDFENETVLLMNSDLLTNIDYSEFYNYFEHSGADMVVATIPYHVNVPYAVMDIDNNNRVSGFKEKPIFTYYSNAGIYLIKKHLFKFIPAGCKFDATDLMDLLMKEGFKIVSFPIHAYWLDIGRMEDFNRAQEDIKHLTL